MRPKRNSSRLKPAQSRASSALKKRAFEMYDEGERLTGHKGLPLEFTPNLAAAE